MHKLDWSDLQYILAVAQQGTLAGAARSLHVNHSTVLRRINAFEHTHGVRLFDRLRSGYQLTSEGEQMLQAAQSVETVVNNLERNIAGKDLRLAGSIRLTTTDSFLFELLTPHLQAFQDLYPDINLNVSVTNHLLNLSRRDADVAIRPGMSIPAPLAGAKICDLNFALYASPDYWQAHGQLEYSAQSWLGLDDVMADAPPGRWLKANVPEERIVYTADTFLALRLACEYGRGIAILPCFLGDAAPNLVRASTVLEKCQNGMLILTHKDLMQTARIKTFTDFMYASLKDEATRLLGAA